MLFKFQWHMEKVSAKLFLRPGFILTSLLHYKNCFIHIENNSLIQAEMKGISFKCLTFLHILGILEKECVYETVLREFSHSHQAAETLYFRFCFHQTLVLLLNVLTAS